MLKVSDNKRFLVRENGAPFFYLGDTAWELFHRLDREEAEFYLKNRAAKGFTVIQAVALAEYNGLSEPNRYGHLPLHDNDPARPNDDYFKHVDDIVNMAEKLGLFVGLLPSWGDKVNKKWGIGPEVFTPQNAAIYGEFLGRRYADKPIIWIVGGDRPPENENHFAIWRAMAAGLEKGDGGRHLMTFHPNGGLTSAQFFHEDAWLDFNMLQSGHNYDHDNYNRIARDYQKRPAKPCLDGEPGYEDHAAGFDAKNGHLSDYDTRKSAYWAIFAGACGHTYGCHDIWQFFDAARHPAVSWARTPWRTAIDLPGSTQVGYARRLIESRPFLTRIPDQSLVASQTLPGTDHIQATRDADGSYAFVYAASGHPFEVNLRLLSGRVRAHWFDPRLGTAQLLGEFANDGEREFMPPSRGAGHDWVLVLDDAGRNFPVPGAAMK